MVADIEELEEMDTSELHARRLNGKETSTPMKCEKFIFPIANGTVKISGGDQDLRTSTFLWDIPDRGEEQNNLRGESEASSSTPRQDSSWYHGEAKDDFWSISGDLIGRRLRRKQTTWRPSTHGQRCGNNICLMHHNVMRSKSGLLRNQSSTMPGDYVCIYFIDSEDEEFKFTMKNARRKLEIPMPAAMPCKTSSCRSIRETCSTTGEYKIKHA